MRNTKPFGFWNDETRAQLFAIRQQSGLDAAAASFGVSRCAASQQLTRYHAKMGILAPHGRRDGLAKLKSDGTRILARANELEAARQSRLNSEHAPLKPGDLDPSFSAANYGKEKRQEYNENMGRNVSLFRDLGESLEDQAKYNFYLMQQEYRGGNRVLARSSSIKNGQESLIADQFRQIAERIQWPVHPHGYAARPKRSHTTRMSTLVLSDLHIGANLPGYENIQTFDFTAAGRRLAHLAHETAEFKTQYRDQTQLNLGLNGDIIEGLLGWNDADNAPLAEQMVAAAQFLVATIQYLAAAFPKIRVDCQTGNHGRNKLTHHGRATSSKWNSFEMVIYKMVEAQCRHLPNVEFHIPKSPWSIIPLLGGDNAFMTHGDTEIKLKSISSSGGPKSWTDALAKIQSEGKYGKDIKVLIAGHFHDPGLLPTSAGIAIAQGALVPPNGHARAAGYSGICGFWLFESVEGFPVGDSRFLRVGEEQDKDASLDQIVKPFNF